MIKIICIGNLKEKYLIEASKEYLKRLQSYTKLEIIEISEQKENAIIESNKIIEKINKKDYLILLDINGKQYSSEELSQKIEKLFLYDNSNVTFIIGGSTGVSDKLKEMCNEVISFSKLTFPHQLFRIILLEQLYRSFKIMKNETYHK
jgi:23S rRNA (pseudouridine1915-N3)-methyltransferase